jgi:predicted helicase
LPSCCWSSGRLVDECTLHYRDIGDYLDRKQKLAVIGAGNIADIEWEIITPSLDGDWINHRNDEFETYTPLVDKKAKALFRASGAGLQTNRDAWVYNYSKSAVVQNVETTAEYFNRSITLGEIDRDPSHISWTSGLEKRFRTGLGLEGSLSETGIVAYRPFNKQNASRCVELIHRPAALRRFFPLPETTNHGFYLTSPASHYPTFELLMVDALPDLHTLDTGQFFPRYTYESETKASLFDDLDGASGGLQRVDNITDAALADYRSAYGPEVSKDDVFHYVYGLLHSPEYRTTFAADLKKMLPRIPQVPGVESFHAFVDAGKALSDLHIGYESLEPYSLNEVADNLALETGRLRPVRGDEDEVRREGRRLGQDSHHLQLADHTGGHPGGGPALHARVPFRRGLDPRALPGQTRQGVRHRQRPERLVS